MQVRFRGRSLRARHVPRGLPRRYSARGPAHSGILALDDRNKVQSGSLCSAASVARKVHSFSSCPYRRHILESELRTTMTPLAALLLLHLSLLPLALSFKAPRSAAEQSRCRSLRPVFLLLTWRLAKAADDEEDLCIKSGSCRQVRGDFKKVRLTRGASARLEYSSVSCCSLMLTYQ